MAKQSKVFYFNPETDSNGNSIKSSLLKYPLETTGTVVFTSDKEEGSGYYNGDGFHSVTYEPWPETKKINYGENNNFRGTVIIQGSLASEPSESDWFDIPSTSTTFDDTYNSNTFHNFSGNYVWIRAKVSISRGVLRQILFNY